MLSIDNAVELMITTYLGLPKGITKLQISRKELAEINRSFPRLLEALERHASDKLGRIELVEIEWYHRLRNELYHQGNGLTVVRAKVIVYAELAQLLFQRLFGFAIQIDKPDTTELIGNFVTAWSNLYQVLESMADNRFPGRNLRGATSIIPEMAAHGYLTHQTVEEIRSLRALRNDVIHGEMKGLRQNVVDRINELTSMLQQELQNTK